MSITTIDDIKRLKFSLEDYREGKQVLREIRSYFCEYGNCTLADLKELLLMYFFLEFDKKWTDYNQGWTTFEGFGFDIDSAHESFSFKIPEITRIN